MSRNTVGLRSLLFFAIAITIAACGGSSDTETASEATTSTEVTEAPDATEAAEPEVADEPPVGGDGDTSINGGKPEADISGDTPVELEIVDLIEGDGDEAKAGDVLSMHYVGVLHENGEQFDASWDRGEPFGFQLGTGQVIQGWDDGIVGMKVGGRRQLTIPAEQAYGATDRDPIPANSALVFVVDLLEVLSVPEVENAPGPATELEVTVLEEGDGDVIIAAGSFVEIHFQFMLQSTGEIVQSSYSVGSPFPFEVGAEPTSVFPAWDEGFIGLRAGDLVRMVMPPEIGPSPDETIVSVVEIVSVS